MPPLPEQAGRKAIELFRSLVTDDPSDPFARDDLVWALWRSAQHINHAEAVSNVNEAVAVGDKLVHEYPASADFRRDLANALRMQSRFLLGKQPTPQSAAEAMPVRRRALELDQAILADLKSNRPEALQPARPEGDEGTMFTDSLMWAKFDVADNSSSTAYMFRLLRDWRHAAEMDELAAPYYKDLVEYNPSVATFTEELANVFEGRILEAEQENARKQAVTWSKEAVAFWNRLAELHPDVPALKTFADDAIKKDAEVAKWLAEAATAQAPATPP